MRRLFVLIGSHLFPAGALDLESGFYKTLCLAGAAIGLLVVIPLNAIQDLPVLVSLVAGAFGLLCLALHIAARRGYYLPGVLFAAFMLTLNAIWFPNAASAGSIPFYFFAALMLPFVFLSGWRRKAAIVLVVANGACLFWIEQRFPDLATPFASEQDRLVDLTVGFVMSAVVCVLVMGAVVAGYRRERRRLRLSVMALDESRTLLSSLIDSTDDMVWLADPQDFRVLLFNAAFASFCRQKAGVEVRIGMHLDELRQFDDPEAWRLRYRRALDEGPCTLEIEREGDTLQVSLSAVRHAGETLGVAVFCKDITAQLAAMARHEQVAGQLQQSQKLESLGKLAGGVAHDFNNMLSGILGYAELLREDESDAKRLRYNDAIIRAATRSADLTRKLLAFARRGKNVVEAVDLGEVVRDSVGMLRPTFRRDVAVSMDVDDLWSVDGDPSQLHQLVVNLCINAAEAMPAGGLLSISGRNTTLDAAGGATIGVPPGDYVAVEYADSGVGMSEEVRARIFEPFFTTKSEGEVKGTGLGLSTVYGVAELHNGGVAVESGLGTGTRFTVYLPKGQLEAATPAVAPAVARGTGLVLLVEDEEMIREFVVEALHSLGYQAVTAVDGVAGVEVFRARHAELAAVLLDLKMPRMGGRDAFLEFRAIDPDVPVLVCSGFGDNEEAQGLITLGARGLLPKPYTLGQLAAHMGRLVR